MAEDKIAEVVLSGTKGQVEYALDDSGQSEAKEWLESQTGELQTSFGVLFRRLVDYGIIHNQQQFRKIKGQDAVWEFKRNGERLFCYRHGRRWLLTHHYQKGHGSKHQSKSAARTATIADKQLERERRAARKGDE